MGWFALTSLAPSTCVCERVSGFYFLYRAAAFAQALNDWCLVSAQEWERGYVPGEAPRPRLMA